VPTRHSGKFGDAIDREVGQTWLFGGIAIVLDLGTRPVAFILSGMMAVAYWQFHAPNGVSPVQNQGVPAVPWVYLVLLFVSAIGLITAVVAAHLQDLQSKSVVGELRSGV
jgi:hypothetical protein